MADSLLESLLLEPEEVLALAEGGSSDAEGRSWCLQLAVQSCKVMQKQSILLSLVSAALCVWTGRGHSEGKRKQSGKKFNYLW